MAMCHLKINILFFLILSSATQIFSMRCFWDVVHEALTDETEGGEEIPLKIDISNEWCNKTTDDYDDRERKKSPSTPVAEDNETSTEHPPKHDFEHSDAVENKTSSGPTNNFHFTFNIGLSHDESVVTHIHDRREEKPPKKSSSVNVTGIAPEVDGEIKTYKKFSVTPQIRPSAESRDKYANDSTNYSEFTVNIDLGHNESKVTHIHHGREEKPLSNTSNVNGTDNIAPEVDGEIKTSKKISITPPIGHSADKSVNGSTNYSYFTVNIGLNHTESKVMHIYDELEDKPSSNTSNVNGTGSIAPQIGENKIPKEISTSPPNSDDSEGRYVTDSTSHMEFDFATDYFSYEISNFFYIYHYLLEGCIVVIIFMVLWIMYKRFKALEKKLKDLKRNRNRSENSECTQELEHMQGETTEGGLLLPSVWTVDKVYHYLKLLVPEAKSDEEENCITDDYLHEVSSYIFSQENALEILRFVNPDVLLQLGKFHHDLGGLQEGKRERIIRVVVDANEAFKKRIKF